MPKSFMDNLGTILRDVTGVNVSVPRDAVGVPVAASTQEQKEVVGGSNFDFCKFTGTKRDKDDTLVEKSRCDDAVWSGINKGRFRTIIAADGVSGAFKGDCMAEGLVYEISNSDGADLTSLVEAVRTAHRKARNEALKYNSRNFNNEVTAATVVAGVIDNKNLLSVISVGDSRGFLVRGNEVRPLNLIQNHMEEEVDKAMLSRNLTRSEAKEYVKETMSHLRNQPKTIRSDEDLPELYTTRVQLQEGDTVFMVTDGVLDGFNTFGELNSALIHASKVEKPATAISVWSYQCQENEKPDLRRDDISGTSIRI